MKIAGIIAEYNPFHNGHQFHIEETRRRTCADRVIVAMSGDFVQRGAPALLSKYDRARMALLHGADLVFELPVTPALSSAEGFAEGGVSLLAGLGVVDCVSCGCESAGSDSELFWQVASLLCEEPDKYRECLRSGLRSGMSFPAARESAVRAACADPEGLKELMSGPNNILALEYARAIKAVNASMDLCLIPRQGDGYHSDILAGEPHPGYEESYSSSTAIRNALLSGHPEESEEALKSAVPPDEYDLLIKAGAEHRLLSENDFSDLLSYALTKNSGHLDEFGPENSDLSRRTEKCLEQFSGWTAFAGLIKTKNQTYTAISRYLAHILLGIRREDLSLAASYHYAPYARLLGFGSEAAPLMKEISERADIPILTRLAKDRPDLPEDRRHLLELDLAASEIYRRILESRSGQDIKPELRQPLVTIS